MGCNDSSRGRAISWNLGRIFIKGQPTLYRGVGWRPAGVGWRPAAPDLEVERQVPSPQEGSVGLAAPQPVQGVVTRAETEN